MARLQGKHLFVVLHKNQAEITTDNCMFSRDFCCLSFGGKSCPVGLRVVGAEPHPCELCASGHAHGEGKALRAPGTARGEGNIPVSSGHRCGTGVTQGTCSSRLGLEVLLRNAIVEEGDWDWDCHSQGMALSPSAHPARFSLLAAP